MVQLGIEIRRLIATMEDHPKPELPLLFYKLEIKYGFWRMDVSDEDAYNFCSVFPYLNPVNSIDYIKILVSNSLQMGWCESPLLFCSSTETARDVIKNLINIGDPLPSHQIENIMINTIHQHSDQP